MLRQRLTRRVLLCTGVVVGTGSLLAACGATPAPAATTAPEATAAPATAAVPTRAPAAAAIEVWAMNWGEIWNKPMMLIGDQFTEATGTKVNWSFNDDWQEKLLTAVAAGIPPDCCYTNYQGLPTLAFEGTMLPLDDYYAASGVKREDFIKAMMDATIWEGKSYGIPGGADFLAFYYNKQVYRDAGLDPEQPPKTLAELIAHSEKIYQFDSSGNITRMGLHITDPNLIFYGFLFDGVFYDDNARKVTCNQGGVVKALEWMVENAKKWPAEKVASFTSSSPGYTQSSNSGFATGKEAYLFSGFWAREALDQYAPDLDYGLFFVPTLNGTEAERKNYVIQGWDYSIPKGAKQPDAAWQFLKYAFYDHAWEMGVNTLNGNCVLAQMKQFEEGVIDAIGKENRLAPLFHIFSETGAAGEKFWPVIPVSSRYYDEVMRAQDFATRGERTAQEALDEAARVTQDELDKALQGA